jgi:hypothetical protein
MFKQQLFQQWLGAHAPGNHAPLFANRAPHFKPTTEAAALLQRPFASQGMYLYIVCFGDQSESTIPVYIGKAANPWKRWNTGHLPGLRKAYRTNLGRYMRSLDLFVMHPELYTRSRVYSIPPLSRAIGIGYAYSKLPANTRELTHQAVPAWSMVVQWCRSRCLRDLPGRVPVVDEALARVAPAASSGRSP